MADFVEVIVIGTKDGGVFVADIDYDEDGCYERFLIKPRRAQRAEQYIFNTTDSNWLTKELLAKGVITDGEYGDFVQKRAEEQKKEQEKYKAEREVKEYRKYLELKAKYEPNKEASGEV